MAMTETYQIYDEDVEQRVLANPKRYLFLDPAERPYQFEINSLDATWRANFMGLVSDTQTITAFDIPKITERAAELDMEVVYFEDPSPTFEWLASLLDEPEVKLNSEFEGTINGFLPFQVQGFNFLKQQRAAVMNWDTGTGKTVGAAGLTKYHIEHTGVDLVIWVVKTHNKINTARSLQKLADLDPLVVSGSKAKRAKIYAEVEDTLRANEIEVVVTNYEKFRDDQDAWMKLVAGRSVFVVLDEMPTKLRNRSPKLYRAFCEVFYTSTTDQGNPLPQAGSERPSELRTVMLSATPIENKPEDFFNCVRLQDPQAAGSIYKFEKNHVIKKRIKTKSRNPKYQYIDVVDGYHSLDAFAAKFAHMVHQVDKHDPDIAAMFPKIMDTPVFVDLTERDQKIYDKLLAAYEAAQADDESELSVDDILAAIGVFQMVCDNPTMVLESALKREEWERRFGKFLMESGIVLPDEKHPAVKAWIKENPKQGSLVALKLRQMVGNDDLFSDEDKDGEPAVAKLEALKEILEGNNGDKAIVFTTFNEAGLPLLSKWLSRWGYDHVVYHGGLSERQKQEAEDRFKTDSNCKVFLSSDSGSDSINLEVANLVVHYDLPWKWATLVQRQNRAHRITSNFDQVRFYTLAVTNSVEDRKLEILDMKHGYHDAVLKGEIADLSGALRTKGDLLYILTGSKEDM